MRAHRDQGLGAGASESLQGPLERGEWMFIRSIERLWRYSSSKSEDISTNCSDLHLGFRGNYPKP